MELNEIKPIWEAYDKKLEEAVKLNQRFIYLIEAEKVKTSLAPLFWRRIGEITLQVGWISVLGIFLGKHFFEPAYSISALVLMGFFAVALVNSVRQAVVIRRMDFSSDIVTIQSSLAMLQTHNLQYARMTVLMIPTFLSFPTVFFRAMQDLHVKAFAQVDMLTLSGGQWWTVQLIAILVLVPLGVWYARQLTYKNVHKNWVKNFIERSSGKRVRKAVEFMKELHSLKFETI
jgi:hypothetical protein